jgi:hypothetical protein
MQSGGRSIQAESRLTEEEKHITSSWALISAVPDCKRCCTASQSFESTAFVGIMGAEHTSLALDTALQCVVSWSCFLLLAQRQPQPQPLPLTTRTMSFSRDIKHQNWSAPSTLSLPSLHLSEKQWSSIFLESNSAQHSQGSRSLC